MERVQELIDKLWRQHQQQESPERLLATVHNLQETLSAMIRSEAAQGAGKVAVVMPPKRRPATVAVTVQPAPGKPAAAPVAPIQEVPIAKIEEPVARKEEPAPVVPQPAEHLQYMPRPEVAEPQPQAAPAEPDAKATPEVFSALLPEVREAQPETARPFEPAAIEPQPVVEPYTLRKPAVTEFAPPVVPPQPAPVVPEPPKQEEREMFHLHFDTTDEAPTLTQQQFNEPPAPKELHEVISPKEQSLNDRLKQEQPELAHRLKEAPIKDLRKAVGVNDKFRYIRELFRGDEAMYERSIKTINNFHILQEAEYWISRELKVKLGWDDHSDVVQSFYALVRRRFA